MITAIISFAADTIFGVAVMCVCTVAWQTDTKNNSK